MKLIYPTVLLALMLAIQSCQTTPKKETSGVDTSGVDTSGNAEPMIIAIGSCNKPKKDGRMWSAIAENDPELFVWLGDIVYGDTRNMDTLRAKYGELTQLAAYQKFAANTKVVGVWDDHDYGENDAGKEFPKKEESEKILLDFLGIDPAAEVRSRPGVYSSTTIGEGKKQIKVILLDGRYFRDSLLRSDKPGRRYEPNPEGDMLGEAQWQWLENELTNSEAKVHIIGCGIQFIPEEHGWEKWANFPKARQRFFDLLEKTNPANPVLISGDRHIAEISKIEVGEEPVYELTASGLTHTWNEVKEEANRYRVGKLIAKRNFGLINIRWTAGREPRITLEARGLNNELFESQPVE